MAQQTIISGTVAKDEQNLKLAYDKINSNFTELYTNIEWTRFYFDRGGSTPSGQINNSQEVGANFGTWTETTAANASVASTSQNTTYDPTLTGVSVTNGMWSIPAGVYHIDCSIYFKIYNTSGTHQKYDFYLYGRSIGTGNWAGSYDTALVLPDTSNFFNNDFVVNLGGIFVFDASTSTNNEFYIQILSSGGSPVGPNLFPDYGFLNIRKLG